MKHNSLTRLGVATTSAISYPALWAAIAVGITTFTVVPVFAESAPTFGFDCTHPAFANCDGKEEMTPCTCASPYTCACERGEPQGTLPGHQCFESDAGDGGEPGLRTARLCAPVNDCERTEDFAACKGKEPDAACTIGKLHGNCITGSLCKDLGADNRYGPWSTGSRCGVVVPPDAGPSSITSPIADDDDGGCSTSSASTSGTVGGLALCFVFVGALCVRARRRRG
jgi:hypothetical protein